MRVKLFFLVALALSAIGIRCMAQESRFLQQETDSLGNIFYARLSTDTIPQPISLSAELLRSMYSKRSADEFKPSDKRKVIRDEQGYTHRYYQQYYKNVKIEDGEATVHSDRKGNIETVFGYFKPVGEVDVTPTLSEAQALEYALKHIGAETYKWQIPEEEQWIKEYYNDTYRPMGELVIVKDQLKTNRIFRLAYRFDIYAHKPMSRNYVWVDAITGDILNMASRIVFTNTAGTAATRYSGSRSITTDSYNGSYRLRETRNGVNISTLNMNHSVSYAASSEFTDNDNNWTTTEHSANNNNAALDAHWGAEMTYEYFKQVYLRNSWNHSNGPLFSYVNANLGSGRNSDNAFWDGEKMTYGQGFLLPPLTTLDICAHEIGHGVFQSEVNYTSSTKEFGAINESLSDIWAARVENWATTGKQTWLIGEDLGSVFRSMSNPNAFGDPDTYGGTYWFNTTGCVPDPQANDNCGVHTNSGVMNYWFYLLAVGGSGTNDKRQVYSVTGIGMDKAAEIVYKAETVYMSRNETFSLARMHTVAAATNLYGTASAEVIAVTNAWHAVGVGNKYTPETIPVTVQNFTNATFLLTFQHSNGYFKRMEIFGNSGTYNTYVEPGNYNSINMYSTTTGGVDYVYTIERQGGGTQTQTGTDGAFYIALNSDTYIFIDDTSSPYPPTISGPTEVCYSGSTFTLSNAPASAITWSVTGPFTVSGSGTTATVTRTGTSTSNGTLTAKINGTAVATKTITPCPPPPAITGSSSTVGYGGITFTLANPPSGTIDWSVTGPFTVSGSGTTATVRRTGTSTDNGTLTASVAGTAVATKTITPCPPITISGSDVCPSTTYRLQNGWATSWSVEPAGVFTVVASNHNSATVGATNPNGQTGTLTAVVNGISFTKAIKACTPSIIGPDELWNSNTDHYFNTGQTATWSVSGGFNVNPTTGVHTGVTPDEYDGRTGTLTAAVNGVTYTKIIQAGYGRTYVKMELNLISNLSGYDPANITGAFYVEALMPGDDSSANHEVANASFDDDAQHDTVTTEIATGDFFTESFLEIDASYYNITMPYYVTVEVFDDNNGGNCVHFVEYEGTTEYATDYITMLGSGWCTPLYPEDRYRMVVYCYIGDTQGSSMTQSSLKSATGRKGTKVVSHETLPSKMEVTVYPNPTDGLLRIDISGGDIPQGAMIEIFAASGAVAGKWTDISSVNTLDISAQPAGVYLVRIMMDRENVCVKKIIKNK